MILDSAVFQISSVAGSPEEAEWASEGVQVGGPGSACGVLGMWTGAEHDANDPLGEFHALIIKNTSHTSDRCVVAMESCMIKLSKMN